MILELQSEDVEKLRKVRSFLINPTFEPEFGMTTDNLFPVYPSFVILKMTYEEDTSQELPNLSLQSSTIVFEKYK